MSITRNLKRASLALLTMVSATDAAGQLTIEFENSGVERGITVPGAREFDVLGSSWSGGVVGTARIPPLYASGAFSYEIVDAAGSAAFEPAAMRIRFFFVHGFGFPSGTATAFARDESVVGTVASRQATSFGAPANFVEFAAAEPIGRVEFSGGVIDSVTFDVVTAATPTPSVAPSATPTPTATPDAPVCAGDCDGNHAVTVDEILRGVSIALGGQALGLCPAFDRDGDAAVTVDEIVAAVSNALVGCA